MGQEELMDTSNMIRVSDDELDMDGNQHFWHEGQKFTGIALEDNPGGGRDEIGYHDGYQHGPARTISADGTVLAEDWYCHAIRHGISREFRSDGTLLSAVAYDGGTEVWRVAVEEDGHTIASVWELPAEAPERSSLARTREVYDLPKVPAPDAATVLSVH